MILTPFCCAWNWDARPFPTFRSTRAFGATAAIGRRGNWIGGKGPYVSLPSPDAPPGPGSYAVFPTLSGQAWSVHYKPRFSTRTAAKASGRETRAAAMTSPLWDIELTFDVLRSDPGLRGIAAGDRLCRRQRGRSNALPVSRRLRCTVPPQASPLGLGRRRDEGLYPERSIGGFVERVQALIGAPTVYQNGVAVSAALYSVSILPATITFTTAPAAGVALTVDFSAAHLARFVDDD